MIDRKKMDADAEVLLKRVGVNVSPRARVRELGIARLQMVEIAKALSLDARVLIMDEPTAVLTSGEVDKLFAIVRRLREDGVGIVFITHHLEEIAALGDRVTVIRDGRRCRAGARLHARGRAGTPHGRAVDRAASIRASAPTPVTRFSGSKGSRATGSSTTSASRCAPVRSSASPDSSAPGGRRSSGPSSAPIRTTRGPCVAGAPLRRHDVNAAMAAGIGLVPEDRKGQGLVLDASVEENLGLVTLKSSARAGLVDLKAQHAAAERIAGQLGVRMAGLGQHVRTLSGGNQQKVVIGKWLLADTKVLILDEPTRGIDVGAKVEIYQLINELTAAGAAVLMISSDLPEVLGMSDRVVVMAQGRVAGELPAERATQDAVMALAVSTPHSNGTGTEASRWPLTRSRASRARRAAPRAACAACCSTTAR